MEIVPTPRKPIRLSLHASRYATPRGFSLAEVELAIREADWQSTGRGSSLECRKDYAFHAEWNQRFYATKTVRPIFVDEPDEIVVITVYTYYY